ncbi:hypothetical protein CFOL_v3_16500 [Cephalotus follicularis]|uniref:BHLH domain-containing protein n=1 Tax=Cephalotus follicularis TaxID=3775 RepID=A0A1Q3BZ20_CEPFO|nr:hypothetical protein CFOL_v3_16500 [Cephalotus follicularis]
MGSEDPALLVDKVHMSEKEPRSRSCPSKKNQGRVTKRINKAEREKLKREHLNELFLELASSLELNQENNGKASILSEASRLLKDLFGQIECLKEESTSLMSESHYLIVEKNELKEENNVLETQIKNLLREVEARVAKPGLNVFPPELEQPVSHFPSVDSSLPQAPAVIVVPLHSDLQGYALPDATQLTSNPPANVSKPHARYPTPADSWPFQILGDQPNAGKEFELSDRSMRVCSSRPQSPEKL